MLTSYSSTLVLLDNKNDTGGFPGFNKEKTDSLRYDQKKELEDNSQEEDINSDEIPF